MPNCQSASLLILAFLGIAFSNVACGQTIPALTEKLVEKGILTKEEARALREQGTLPKTSNAVQTIKFFGDVRPRFEQHTAASPQFFERNRFRMRLRVGATVSLPENFEVGFRLATGNPWRTPSGVLLGGSAVTANQDFNSLESRRFLWVDAAYAKWNAIKTDDLNLSATIGKFDNPFAVSNMIFDYDLVPEGASLVLTHDFNKRQSIRAVAAFFVMDEFNQPAAAVPSLRPTHDPYVYGAQLLWESQWNSRIETSLGIAAFNIAHEDSLISSLEGSLNAGTSRDPATGAVRNNIDPVIGSASATYNFENGPLYKGAFPIKIFGEYMYNPSASANNVGYRVGLTLGKANRKNRWEITYRYQRLEADAWFDAFVDDGNGAFYAIGNPQLDGTGRVNGFFAGTNVKGHYTQLTYSLSDSLNCSVSYYLNSLIINAPGQPSDGGHLIADLLWRF